MANLPTPLSPLFRGESQKIEIPVHELSQTTSYADGLDFLSERFYRFLYLKNKIKQEGKTLFCIIISTLYCKTCMDLHLCY